MKRIAFYIFVMLCAFLIGSDLTLAWLHYNKASALNDRYFPPNTFGEKRREQIIVKWYGACMKAMSEPSLYASIGEVEESYRVYYAPSFEPQIAVRIWLSDGKRFLTAKKLDGDNCFEKVNLSLRLEREISEEEWDLFIAKLEKANFWDLPVEPRGPGVDGYSFFLEGIKNDKYHIVNWYVPDDKNYLEACNYLLELSGVNMH